MNSLPRFVAGAAAVAIATVCATGCGHKSSNDQPSATFAFATDPAASYLQVDRVGMPAVGTAVISSKDAYNVASPAEDATGLFVGQISSNLDSIHTKLNDDITAAGLIPSVTGSPSTPGTSLNQAAPLVLPDTLKIDTTTASGFPNGRKLPDRVIDITLAVLLLDFTQGGQNATTLANLPLNPGANDKAFSATFPYLAAPF